jgi:hypothetical protein
LWDFAVRRAQGLKMEDALAYGLVLGVAYMGESLVL